MTPEIVVRPVREEEWAAVGQLCVDAYTAGGHLRAGDPYISTLADVGARAAAAEVLVAESDGVVVGTVTICPPESPFAELSRPGESEFRFLAVSPGAWRSGIGEQLLAACEERAQSRGQHAHIICVIEQNPGGLAFYRRLGFERAPARDWVPVPGVHLQALTRRIPWRGEGTAAT